MLYGYLPKKLGGFLGVAAAVAVLAVVGDTIHHGFAVEDVVAGVLVGILGVAGGCGLAKLSGVL